MFDADLTVMAYRLEFQDSTAMFGIAQDYKSLDGAMHSPGIEVLNQIGLDPFTGGKPIFVTVNQFMLLADFSKSCQIAPESTVCVITREMPLEPIYINKCSELKDKGFSIALDGVEHSAAAEPLYRLAKYIMVDAAESDFMAALRLVRVKYPHPTAVIKNIKFKEKFDEIHIVPNSFFSGPFFTQPITKGVSSVSPLKLNALDLLRVINEDDFDLEQVSKIVGRDVSLSISLLKFINSPMIGITSKVNSIRGAVALLGQNETRKWVTVAVSNYMSEDKPGEISKVSLIRAKFAENLATVYELGVHMNALFLMGLFSLLDVILGKPMEEAVKNIFIDNKVKDALVNRRGEFAPVLEMLYCYESADWKGVCYLAVMHNLNIDHVCKAFIDSLMWYKELLGSIN